jgi:hypothetical protein
MGVVNMTEEDTMTEATALYYLACGVVFVVCFYIGWKA